MLVAGSVSGSCLGADNVARQKDSALPERPESDQTSCTENGGGCIGRDEAALVTKPQVAIPQGGQVATEKSFQAPRHDPR